jgi:hypothetical protein
LTPPTQRRFGSRQSGSNDRRAGARSLDIVIPSCNDDFAADIPGKRGVVLIESRTTTMITGTRHNIPIQKSTSKKFMIFPIGWRLGVAAPSHATLNGKCDVAIRLSVYGSCDIRKHCAICPAKNSPNPNNIGQVQTRQSEARAANCPQQMLMFGEPQAA